jgi:hypothetical protein
MINQNPDGNVTSKSYLEKENTSTIEQLREGLA